MNDDITDFVADLVTEQEWAMSFLTSLFNNEKGAWLPVKRCCGDVAGALQKYLDVMGNAEYDLMVTYLDHPVGVPD